MTRWTYDKQQQTGLLVITGPLTVAQAGEVKELLLKAISQASLVQVDLGQVEQIDIAGLQLFCAAHRLAARQGKAVEVKVTGERVGHLAHSAGLVHAVLCDKAKSSACLWR